MKVTTPVFRPFARAAFFGGVRLWQAAFVVAHAPKRCVCDVKLLWWPCWWVCLKFGKDWPFYQLFY